MLSFDWKQKRGPCKDGGEIWVVWAPHNGAAVPGRACVLQQGGACVNGLMAETIPLIQATNASSIPHGARQKGRK